MSIPQQKDFDDSISLKILHEVSKQASEDKFLGPKLTVHQVSKMLKTAGASKSESRLLAQRFFDTFGVTPVTEHKSSEKIVKRIDFEAHYLLFLNLEVIHELLLKHSGHTHIPAADFSAIFSRFFHPDMHSDALKDNLLTKLQYDPKTNMISLSNLNKWKETTVKEIKKIRLQTAQPAFLKASFKVGSIHSRVGYALKDRVFHPNDVPENSKQSRKVISDLLNSHTLTSGLGRPWNTDTQGVLRSRTKQAPWDDDPHDNRTWKAEELKEKEDKRQERLRKIRGKIDPDADPRNIHNKQWNDTVYIKDAYKQHHYEKNNLFHRSKTKYNHTKPVPNLIERHDFNNEKIIQAKRILRNKETYKQQQAIGRHAADSVTGYVHGYPHDPYHPQHKTLDISSLKDGARLAEVCNQQRLQEVLDTQAKQVEEDERENFLNSQPIVLRRILGQTTRLNADNATTQKIKSRSLKESDASIVEGEGSLSFLCDRPGLQDSDDSDEENTSRSRRSAGSGRSSNNSKAVGLSAQGNLLLNKRRSNLKVKKNKKKLKNNKGIKLKFIKDYSNVKFGDVDVGSTNGQVGKYRYVNGFDKHQNRVLQSQYLSGYQNIIQRPPQDLPLTERFRPLNGSLNDLDSRSAGSGYSSSTNPLASTASLNGSSFSRSMKRAASAKGIRTRGGLGLDRSINSGSPVGFGVRTRPNSSMARIRPSGVPGGEIQVRRKHLGTFTYVAAEEGEAWTCCANNNKDSQGCSKEILTRPQKWNFASPI